MQNYGWKYRLRLLATTILDKWLSRTKISPRQKFGLDRIRLTGAT